VFGSVGRRMVVRAAETRPWLSRSGFLGLRHLARCIAHRRHRRWVSCLVGNLSSPERVLRRPRACPRGPRHCCHGARGSSAHARHRRDPLRLPQRRLLQTCQAVRRRQKWMWIACATLAAMAVLPGYALSWSSNGVERQWLYHIQQLCEFTVPLAIAGGSCGVSVARASCRWRRRARATWRNHPGSIRCDSGLQGTSCRRATFSGSWKNWPITSQISRRRAWKLTHIPVG